MEEEKERASYRKIRLARERGGEEEVERVMAVERTEFLDEIGDHIAEMRVKYPDNWWWEEAVNWRDIEEWMLGYMMDDGMDWIREIRGERTREVKLSEEVKEEIKEREEMLTRQREQEAKIKVEYARFAESTTEEESGEEEEREDNTETENEEEDEREEDGSTIKEEREAESDEEEEDEDEKEEGELWREILENRYEEEMMYDEERKESWKVMLRSREDRLRNQENTRILGEITKIVEDISDRAMAKIKLLKRNNDFSSTKIREDQMSNMKLEDIYRRTREIRKKGAKLTKQMEKIRKKKGERRIMGVRGEGEGESG